MSADVIPQDLRAIYREADLALDEDLLYAGRVKMLIERIASLEADLALWRRRAEWQEITLENLPEIGEHEVGRTRLESPKGTWIVCDVADTPWKGDATARQYKNFGWTHFRPINPPARAQVTE